MTEAPELEFEEPIAPTELVGKTGIIMRSNKDTDTPERLAFIERHRPEMEALNEDYKHIKTEDDLASTLLNQAVTEYGIWLDDKYIGFRTRKEETDGSVSTGCIIDVEHRGHGFGSDSLMTLAEHEFTSGDTQAIIAYVDKNNSASIASMSKAGFAQVRPLGDDLYFRLDKYDWLKNQQTQITG